MDDLEASYEVIFWDMGWDYNGVNLDEVTRTYIQTKEKSN